MSKKLVKWFDYSDVLANRPPKFVFASSTIADGIFTYKNCYSFRFPSIFRYDEDGYRIVISRYEGM